MDENEKNTPDVIAALERERDGYLATGKTDRAEQCDAEIARLSGEKPKSRKSTAAALPPAN